MRMFTGKRKLWFIVPALAASVLLIGACSSDDDEETATPTESAVAAETATEAPTEAATSTEAPTEAATASETAAAEAATVVLGGNADLGDFLTDAEGNSLYLFTNDEAGVSNCADTCAENWPPLLLEEGDPTGGEGVTGTLAVIERADGGRQVTYNDQPLYYFAADAAAGDTTGQGVNDVWFIVAP